MRKRLAGLALVAALSAVVFAGTASAVVVTKFVPLNGVEEVPPGNPLSAGAASLTFDTDTDTVCWLIIASNIDFPSIGAHIHRAPMGVAGPVVIPFTPPVQLLPGFGMSTGCVTDADVDAVVANPFGHYVNVHTRAFPPGIVRGQIR